MGYGDIPGVRDHNKRRNFYFATFGGSAMCSGIFANLARHDPAFKKPHRHILLLIGGTYVGYYAAELELYFINRTRDYYSKLEDIGSITRDPYLRSQKE